MGLASFNLQRSQQAKAEAEQKNLAEKNKEELKALKKDQKQSTKHNTK
jgi:hypothetical protein